MLKLIQNKKLIGTLLLTVFLAIFQTGTINASELKFSVNPELPKNQVDESKTYFDLKLNPDETQTLNVNLKNDTNDSIEVKPKIGRATTNSNGVVEYSSNNEKEFKEYFDNSIKNDFIKHVSVESRVTIPAKSTVQVPIKVKMPSNGFPGQMAGGITFEQSDVSTKKSDQQTNIVNKYTYVVGIVLQNSTKKIKPDLKLGDVQANQINYRNVITADVHNITPSFIGKIGINGFITKKNDDRKLYTVKENISNKNLGKQIAPNSIYPLPFELNGDKFKPGKYTIDLTLTSHDNKWHFNKDFTIVDKNADKFNNQDVTVTNINWWMVSGIALLMLLLLGLVIRVLRKKAKSYDQ